MPGAVAASVRVSLARHRRHAHRLRPDPGQYRNPGLVVQWSAVLATFFFLLALLWHERPAGHSGQGGWRMYGSLVLLAAASACCFSRGVLTGAILAFAVLLPALFARETTGWGKRLGLASLCALPAVAVAAVIIFLSGGNLQHMNGHLGEAVEYGLGFFLLNPAYLLFGITSWGPGTLLLLAGLKLTLVGWGLWLASGRGAPAASAPAGVRPRQRRTAGSRPIPTPIRDPRQFAVLLQLTAATLPFAGLLLAHAVDPADRPDPVA